MSTAAATETAATTIGWFRQVVDQLDFCHQEIQQKGGRRLVSLVTGWPTRPTRPTKLSELPGLTQSLGFLCDFDGLIISNSLLDDVMADVMQQDLFFKVDLEFLKETKLSYVRLTQCQTFVSMVATVAKMPH